MLNPHDQSSQLYQDISCSDTDWIVGPDFGQNYISELNLELIALIRIYTKIALFSLSFQNSIKFWTFMTWA